MEGYIADYWEQGWEGHFWYTFQDATYIDERTGQWDIQGMHQLAVGDYLTIYQEDGTILWDGLWPDRSPGMLARWWSRVRGLEPVCPEKMLTWFRHEPPLKARLVKASQRAVGR